MMQARHSLASTLNHWSIRWISHGSLAIHIILAIGFTINLLGCSMNSEKKSGLQTTREEPARHAAPLTERPPEPQAAVKDQTLERQPFRIQELVAREQHGQTTLQIKFSQPVDRFRHFVLAQPSRIVLDVFGEAQRLGSIESFRIDTNWVSTLRLTSGDGHLRLTAEVAAAAVPSYVVSPDDGGLKIVIGSSDQKVIAKKDVILVTNGKRTDILAAGASTTESKSQAASIAAADVVDKTYTGQKISLDFKDADIKNVFRLLAEVSGLNMIVTPDVNRRVTIRLIEVPWDQALDLLVETNGLVKEQVGNVVRISTAGALKSENDALAAARRSREEREPLHTTYFNLNYAKARDLEPRVKTLMTKRPDAALVIDERSNTVMVRDVKKSVDDVSTLIGKLDTRTPQILIESNLIETTPTFARALGIRLRFTVGGTTFSSAQGAGTPFAGNTAPASSAPTGLGGTVSVIQNTLGGIRNLAAALEAAESEGNIRIISRPSVVTLNNVASTIRSERILRIALPQSTNIAAGSGSSAGVAVATERIPVGIILTVTPQVSSDGYVLLNISVKSSSIADSATVAGGTGGVIPFDELNREAVANVLVRDGETIVIGGILKDTTANSESGVPYLKDLPVLGWLFKNVRWQKDFEELMVFITPRISSAGSENLPAAEQLWREQMKKTYSDQPPSRVTPP
jgi:type IV pilus secretin PilQ/predicted competence protein